MPITDSDESLFDAIRGRLRHEYHKALEALARLEHAFNSANANSANSRGSSGGLLLDSLANGLSARESVLLCICDTWLDVQEIVRLTGFSQKQVRGVLYAIPLKDVVKRDRVGSSGKVRFQISRLDFIRQFKGEKKPLRG